VFAEFVAGRFPELLLRTKEHLLLTGVSTGAAVLAGIPLGIFITGKPWLRSFVFSIVGVIQTVPSLAMLVFLLALIGKIGVVPAIIALTLYALLPIVQNTVTGIEGVPPDILEASAGMGMTEWQQMRMVRLPMAMPVMVAGIKTAAVIGVGIATLSAFIGAGGLGEFINRGLSLSDTRLILLGAIPSALLAVYVNFAIAAVELGLDERRRKGIRLLSGRAGKSFAFAPLMALFLLAGLGQAWQAESDGRAGTVRIGSKNFTEQLILAEIMAQRIEAATGLEVLRRVNLGGTMICHGALLKGEIDMYPEYTGTALTAILKTKDAPTDPEEIYKAVSRAYGERFDLVWLDPFGFNNTYVFAVRAEDARKFGWRKLSDLRGAAHSLRAGFPAEFSERPDGYPGVRKAYGIRFGEVKDLDPALMYDAVRNAQVDIISAFSTDSRIPGYNLAILRDDRSFFPPYHAAPVVRGELLRSYPEVAEALAPLLGILDEPEMQALNYRVDQEKRDPADVAGEFLRERGLLR
jgi:osmoprotectant transport system permease protein